MHGKDTPTYDPTGPFPSDNREILLEEIDPCDDEQFKYVITSWIGIVIGGVLYPLVLYVILMGWFAISEGLPKMTVADLPTVFLIVLVYILFAAASGALISGFTGIASILLVTAVNATLGNPLTRRIAVITAGSLAGFIPTAWVFFGMAMHSTAFSSSQIRQYFMIGFFGPVLAMLMGAWGGYWYYTKYTETSVTYMPVRRKPHRLTIIHLFAATTWVAAMFGFINLTGGMYFAISVVAWFFLNLLLLGGYWFMTRRKVKNRQNR